MQPNPTVSIAGWRFPPLVAAPSFAPPLPLSLASLALAATTLIGGVFSGPDLAASPSISKGRIAELAVDLTADSASEFPASSSPADFVLLDNGKVVFSAEDAFSPGRRPVRRLWVTEGTTVSTRALPADGEIVAATSTGVYSVDSLPSGSSSSRLIWRTDGSSQGTLPLFELNVGDTPEAAALGEIVYLVDKLDNQVFATDGSPGPATRVGANIRVESLAGLTAVAGRIVFTARNAGTSGAPSQGRGLWQIDGATGVGRHLLTDPDDDLALEPVVSGGRAYLGAGPGSGLGGSDGATRLWSYDFDSDTANQILSREILRVGDVRAGRPGEAIFTATSSGDGQEIWRTRGTESNTRRLTDLPSQVTLPFTPGSLLWAWPLGDDVLFLAEGGLWRTGPGPEEQTLLEPARGSLGCAGQAEELIPFGDRFAFECWTSGGNFSEIGITDGTESGTFLLSDICSTTCTDPIWRPQAHGGHLYFLAEDDHQRQQVWRTDGTDVGTHRLSEGPNSLIPQSFGPVVQGSKGLVTSLEDLEYGDEPWVARVDGRGVGILLDVAVERVSSEVEEVATIGEQVYLRAEPDVFVYDKEGSLATAMTNFDSSHPSRAILSGGERAYTWIDGSEEVELWALGEAAFEARKIGGFSFAFGDGPNNMTPCQGADYFLITEGGDGGLWKVIRDGTSVEQIEDSGEFQDKRFFGLTCTRDTLHFLVSEQNDTSFYSSDGTPAGMEVLTRITALPYYEARVSEPAEMDGHGYFTLCLGGRRLSLWRRSGSAAPELVLPETSGDNFWQCSGASPLAAPVVIADRVYVSLGVQNGFLGLLRTDGTQGGTGFLLRDEEASSVGKFINPEMAEAAGGAVFTHLSEDSGLELWLADDSGARLLKDIRPGFSSSSPSHLTTVSDLVYFVAADGAHGEELWVTDGTEEGTHLVHDLYPGAFGSRPSELTLVDDRLYFVADDGLTGRELWYLPLDGTPPCRMERRTLCLSERFKLEGVWEDFQNRKGRALAHPLTDDTGAFYFFDKANLELMVKTLDGSSLNGHRWTFYGALSNVEYHMTVTDTDTGLTRRYFNPKHNFASVGDTRSFGPLGANFEHAPEPLEAAASPPMQVIGFRTEPASSSTVSSLRGGDLCTPRPSRLCLQGGRFAVETFWTDFQGNRGIGTTVPQTSDTGAFWFFRDTNLELLIKVLDGRANNGNFWVFLGALSNVDFDVRVTDTLTGVVKVYQNRSRRFASFGDTRAFEGR